MSKIIKNLHRSGNAKSLIIPKSFLDLLGIDKSVEIDIITINGKSKITLCKPEGSKN